MRLSIEPTYDSRETGPRYSIETRICDSRLGEPRPLADPFVRHTVKIHWRDAICCLFRFGCIKVEVTVDGDPDIVADVMELDGNYIGFGSTRRSEFHRGINEALSQMGEDE